MEKTMKARVQHKHDIEANWLKATNFTPLASEIIVYDPDENYDYPRIKIGDGETNINALPFVTKDYAKISDIPTKPEDIGALPDSTVIPTVPTKISAFENDKGYLTQHQSLDAYAKTADLGALATKDSLTASDVGALPSTTKIPGALSDLSEDTTHRVVTDAEKEAWSAKSNFSGSYDDLTNKPTIPSIAGLASTTYVDDAVKNKVDKDGNKVLSTNDYTTAEKNKLANIAAGAEVNVNADWNATSGDAQILNKPTLGSMAAKSSVVKSDLASDVQTSLGKADSALQPGNIFDWAKQPSKPSYTKSEVGLGNVDNVKQYSAQNPPVVAQDTAPADTSVVWVDTDDNTVDEFQDAVNTALAQAKASGEFDGEDGQRGIGLLSVTTAPSSYTTAVGGITPKYRMAISTIKTQAGVTEVLLGDTVRYSYYHYPIDYLDASYAYFTERVSIRGATGAAGKDAVLTMFISPDGSDSNDGLTASTPKKTVKACATAGAKRISAKRGVYKENVLLTNIGELEILPTDNDLTYAVGVEREPIVFDTSDTVAVSSLAAYNSIKRVAYSNSANTQFDKVFTKKSLAPIVGDGYGSKYNATIWLLSEDEKTVCIKLKPVLTVAECEAEANTFTYVSGYIYINASMTSVAKIVVPTNWETGFYVNGADRLVLKEVEVRFSGTYNIDIRNCAYFDFYKCACKYTSYGSGFHPFNSNGKMTACYATKNFDGYGISGYGHTTYVDCVSEFNFDDGMSHHNGTSGTVIGGRYEGNGKGGNTPAYGAKVNIYGGLYKDNASFGIGYLWATDLEPASGMVQGAVMVGNPVGLSVNKNCDVIAMNCTYNSNTTDVDNKGNLTEYNPAYVESVNGIKPDENGNVKIEVSGGETSGYTNVLPLAINADKTTYVGDHGEKGYRTGYRISSSGVEKASDKNDCSGFIACKSGDTIRIKNGTPETSGYSVQYCFNALFEILATAKVDMSTATAVNGIYSFTIPTSDMIAYIRLTLGNIDDTTIVTVNEEIAD